MKKNILTLALAIVSCVWMMGETQINSLCDEWNVLEISVPNGPRNAIFKTSNLRLTTDTVITSTNQRYVKLEDDRYYIGAMREGTNRDIYYIPAGSTHEYLLYAFNAEVGDRLSNLWYGGRADWCPDGYNATVRSISENTPRVFTIEVEYTYSDSEGEHIIPYNVYWTEGVGMSDGPVGQECPGPFCACSCEQVLLCAYKNGEQVYVSKEGKEYSCEFNGWPDGNWRFFSLCDEWNILVEPFDYFSSYYTYKQQLTTDTIIDDIHAIKLQQGEKYLGALTEGVFGNISYTPANSTKWYTLYVFDTQVGEAYSNVWIGGNEKQYPEEGYNATVENIQGDTIILKITCGETDFERYMIWIKGVGMETGPVGWACLPGDPVDPTPALLCAYKYGNQVYASYLSQKYGCEYNAGPAGPQTTDTIPLYSRDDSGSSTVDPVDPNQIYATLTGDMLTVHNNTGAQVTFTLNNTSVNNVAARARKNTEPVSFTESVSVELLEDGIYEILLTSEEWNYIIYGTVNYIHSATDITKEETTTTKKVLRGTQILIERAGKTYTLTGQEVK